MTELRRNHERHVEGAAARAVRAPKASLGISLSSQNARRPTRRPSSSAPRRSRSRSLLPAGSRCAVAPARAACLANGIARLLAHAVSHAARALRAILCFRGSRSLASTNPRLQPPGARDGRRDACAGGRERHVARGRSTAQGLSCHSTRSQLSAHPRMLSRRSTSFRGLALLSAGDGQRTAQERMAALHGRLRPRCCMPSLVVHLSRRRSACDDIRVRERSVWRVAVPRCGVCHLCR